MSYDSKPIYEPKYSPLESFFRSANTDAEDDPAEGCDDIFMAPCLYSDFDGLKVLNTANEAWDFLNSHSQFIHKRGVFYKGHSHKFQYLNDHTVFESRVMTVWIYREEPDPDEGYLEKNTYAAILRFNGKQWKIVHLMFLKNAHDFNEYEESVRKKEAMV